MLSKNKWFVVGLALAVLSSFLYVYDLIEDPVLILAMLVASFILPADFLLGKRRQSE